MSLLSTILPKTLAAGPAERSFWMPEQASTGASSVDLAFNVVTWISIFFFVLVVAIMAVFIIKYRRVEGREAEQTATHHTPLELTWTIVPLALVIVIFYVGMVGYLDLRVAPTDAYRVHVTGQKWSWNFEHPSGCIEANILRVPAGRPVRLQMSSDDVIHSLYIPAFRVKQDVVPGRFSSLWFEATEPGTYDLFCAEYCGTDHSKMVGQVIVYEDEQSFDEAIRECREWIEDVPQEALYIAGSQLYNRCQSCHSLEGPSAIGPSFLETHELLVEGGQRRLADGSTVTVDEEYIRESILDPSAKIVEGRVDQMSSFQGQLTTRQLMALTEFIRRLDEIPLDDRGRPQRLSPDEIAEQYGSATDETSEETQPEAGQ